MKPHLAMRSLDVRMFALVFALLPTSVTVASGDPSVTRISVQSGTPQNAPTLVTIGGQLAAAWYRLDGFNGYSRVGWAFSADAGTTWREGVDLQRLNAFDSIDGLPTLTANTGGGVILACLYQSFPLGYTLATYRRRVQADSLDWEGPNFLLPVLPNSGHNDVTPYDSPQLAFDPGSGALYLAYTMSSAPDPWLVASTTIYFMRSLDGGLTWDPPQPLSSAAAMEARIAVGPDGEVYVVWNDLGLGQAVGRKSTDSGASFGTPFVVGELRGNLGTNPPEFLGSLRGNPVSYWLYNHYLGHAAIAVDRSSSRNRGSVYVAWDEEAEGTPTPLSGNAVPAYDPNDSFGGATPVEFGDFVSGDYRDMHITPRDLGEVFTFEGTAGTTVWIRGEIYDVVDLGDFGLGFELLSGPDTTSLKRIAFTTIGGPGSVNLPPLVCTLPRTGRYYLRATSLLAYGALLYHLEFRTLDVSQGSVARDHRDIVLVSSRDGGATWLPKVRVNDDPPRFDNCMPEVAVDDFGGVNVAWYDRRDDGVWGALVNTYLARSTDGGRSFEPSVRLSSQSGSWRLNFSGVNSPGTHLALAASGHRVHALWTQQGQPDWDIYGTYVEVDTPTAIGVSGLSAEVAGDRVRLRWLVSRAEGIRGFRVHRAEGQGDEYVALGSSLRAANGEGIYKEEDATAQAGRTYRYRLEIVRTDGGVEWDGPVQVVVPARTLRLAIGPPRPNPSSAVVQIELLSPSDVEGEVVVHDVAGHSIATIHRGRFDAGAMHLTWTGRDRSGRIVPAGIYWVSARSGDETASARMVRIQ